MTLPFPIAFFKPQGTPSPFIPVPTQDLFFYVDANYYSGSGDWLDLSGNAIDFIPVGSPTFTSDPTNSYFTLDGEFPGAGQDLFYHDLSA
jgi:hypothetical protein